MNECTLSLSGKRALMPYSNVRRLLGPARKRRSSHLLLDVLG
jgi:hypothetical protein